MIKKVRVRFAPSPTGPLHIGSVRTALYNYLFARKNKGYFILRIEDTDKKRVVAGAENYIFETLKWCGIEPDEGPCNFGSYGPYRQSQRNYKPYINHLLECGQAYYAFDTPNELELLRKKCKYQFTYNAKTRYNLENSLCMPLKEVNNRLSQGVPYVIRFKVPNDQLLKIVDLIRGTMIVNSSTIDDKILVKSDGIPTYHLANVVDDHLMQITHIIRGEEWLASTPLHILLYKAFGWQIPNFAHLPLILNPTGKGKLSKRDCVTFRFPVVPLQWKDCFSGVFLGYRESGYFPEAFINMLAILGWNPGNNQEIFSLEELKKIFSLERVHKSSARFSNKKAKWFNQQYLQIKPINEITLLFCKELKKRQINADNHYIKNVVEVVRSRSQLITELWEHSYYFFISPTYYEYNALKKVLIFHSVFVLSNLAEVKDTLQRVVNFTSCNVNEIIKNFVKTNKVDVNKLIQTLRLALVGGLHGEDIFFIMKMIGRKESLTRIERIYDVLHLDYCSYKRFPF